MAGARSRRWPAAVLGLALGLGLAGAASAQPAFVGGDLRAPVRSGPGNEFRILETLKAGEPLQVLERDEGWVRVRTPSGKQGWMADIVVVGEAPPLARLAQLEAEAEKLRSETTSLREENTRLASAKQEFDQRAAQLDRLEEENRALKAGARWPEWITGAALLGIGMATGAALTRTGGRRNTRRLRL
jgi:SH3 domain protein